MKLLVLGSSGGAPTKKRNCTSFVLRTESYGIMLDCAEGTQRQMLQAGYKLSKIRYIFISHLHFDHIGGLIPMLSTKSMFGIGGKITILGPSGIKEFIDFNLKISNSGLSYELEVVEVEDGKTYFYEDFYAETHILKHRIACYGYRIVFNDIPGNILKEKLSEYGLTEGPVCGRLKKGEAVELEDGRIVTLDDVATPEKPGKIFGYIADTYLTKGIYKTAQDADMAIIESTFLNEDENRAIERTHLTASMAANVAQRAAVKEIMLFHFSAAYTDPSMFAREAQVKFEGVIHFAEDLKEIEF